MCIERHPNTRLGIWIYEPYRGLPRATPTLALLRELRNTLTGCMGFQLVERKPGPSHPEKVTIFGLV